MQGKYEEVLTILNKGLEELPKDELKEKNELLRSQLQEKSESKYEVFLPEGYTKVKKYPMFFTLHGDGKNIEHQKYFGNQIGF